MSRGAGRTRFESGGPRGNSLCRATGPGRHAWSNRSTQQCVARDAARRRAARTTALSERGRCVGNGGRPGIAAHGIAAHRDFTGPATRRAWGARTLDLDLLLFDDLVIETPRLVVPHPWLPVRRFVLAPAVEVAAGWPHPVSGWTLARLLSHLNTAPNYIAAVRAAGRRQDARGRRISRPARSEVVARSRANSSFGSGRD